MSDVFDCRRTWLLPAWKLPVIEFVSGQSTADGLQPLRRHAVARWLSVLGLLVVVGCGDRGPERVAAQGMVQFDGQPIADGLIRFIPQEGTRGPKAAAAIVNGKYALNVEEGPPVGRLRVEIRQGGLVPAGLTQEDDAVGNQKLHPPPNKIPPQFNEKSSLSVDAVAGKINTFDFDLKASR